MPTLEELTRISLLATPQQIKECAAKEIDIKSVNGTSSQRITIFVNIYIRPVSKYRVSVLVMKSFKKRLEP